MLSYHKAYKDLFAKPHDYSHLFGQDNFHYYSPKLKKLRLQSGDTMLDLFCIIGITLISGASLQLSFSPEFSFVEGWQEAVSPGFIWSQQGDEQWAKDLEQGETVRFLTSPSEGMEGAIHRARALFFVQKVIPLGRFELPYYLQEKSLSHEYHRYGNLGDRELFH